MKEECHWSESRNVIHIIIPQLLALGTHQNRPSYRKFSQCSTKSCGLLCFVFISSLCIVTSLQSCDNTVCSLCWISNMAPSIITPIDSGLLCDINVLLLCMYVTWGHNSFTHRRLIVILHWFYGEYSICMFVYAVVAAF